MVQPASIGGGARIARLKGARLAAVTHVDAAPVDLEDGRADPPRRSHVAVRTASTWMVPDPRAPFTGIGSSLNLVDDVVRPLESCQPSVSLTMGLPVMSVASLQPLATLTTFCSKP
jgi:hypothetical protein